MPAILERLKNQLVAKGKPESNAWAIATSQLQKHGVLKKGSQELTPKGEQRQTMGAAGRAKDRASKQSGRPSGDYGYNPSTNRATLKYGEGGKVISTRRM
jgi:hypothetical protein